MNVLATVVTAVATVVLARLTSRYVLLTGQILDSQRQPCVILTVVHESSRPTVLQLLVRNIGHSIATNIRFTFSRPIPQRAWGIETDKAQKAETMNAGPLINGIPALAPNEERRIDWGQFGGLIATLGDEPITVECNYNDGSRKLQNVCMLDVKSFEFTQAHRGELRQIADDLEKIRASLGHFETGFRKLKIQIERPKTNPQPNDSAPENITNESSKISRT